MLEKERQFYADRLAEWLSRFPGKFVVVKGQELLGVFDTVEEALAEGARRFALEPFLVRRVQPTQDEVNIPALSLGILIANTPPSV
ncbi:MAG: hypothetical protein ACR2G5_18525 [Pyrinomonadaceae bacterium]